MLPISQLEIPHELIVKLGAIQNITFPRQGHTSDVGIIHSEAGRTVVKRARGEQYSQWLRREASILESLAQTDLRVPKVYQFIEQQAARRETESWLLMEYLPGETLRKALTDQKDPAIRYQILFDFGRSLRTLHSVPCPEELKTSGTWLDQMLKQAEYNLEHYQVEGDRALLEELVRNRPLSGRQTLIHGDCTVDNVLVYKGKVSGFIDWSGGAYGDPRYDVSLAIRPKPYIFESLEDHGAFFDGYGDKIITDEDYQYFEEGLYAFF